MNFYFDDSVHDRGGFIVGAYVYGPDADAEVASALASVGLRPETDEFKSSARMTGNPQRAALRLKLAEILIGYRIAILVTARDHRQRLGEDAVRGLAQIIRANGLERDTPMAAMFDEGLFRTADRGTLLASEMGIDRHCDIRLEQDSREVRGIQLADLVAHSAGTMLLETIGAVDKQVKAGPDSGYPEDLDVSLGFELWAGLRYQFFVAGPTARQDPVYRGALMDVGHNGLVITPSCPPALKAAATECFGQVYLGCIH